MTMSASTALQRRDRLERYRSARARLDPSGDPSMALERSYVALAGSVSSRITAELALAPTSSHLLLGGVGSGKTTELMAIQSLLPQADDGFRALYLDVSKQHDIAKMVPGAIAVQVGLALARSSPGTDLKEVSDRLEAIAHGYWDEDPEEPPPPPGEEVPGLLISPEPVAVNIQHMLPLLERLVVNLEATHKHVVVLLDGLDRMTDMMAFERVAIHDVKALNGLGIGVVLVGPLRAQYGLDRTMTERFDSTHYQPWIDVAHNASGQVFLTKILERRVSDDIIVPDATAALVAASGGVVRDLLTLTQSACVEAYVDGADCVGLQEVAAAIDTFGRKHLQGIRSPELEILQRVRTKGTFVHTSEDDLALLMTRRVLEYRNDGRLHYAVHPTIEKLLSDIGDR